MASEYKDLSGIAGANIRARRKELHYSQTDLAGETGSDKSAISRIESGKQELTVTMLGWIAKALETEPGVLLKEGTGETNADFLIRFIEENRGAVNVLPRRSVEKVKRLMALSMDLTEE